MPYGCDVPGLRALGDQVKIRYLVHCSTIVSLFVGPRVNTLHGERTLSQFLQDAIDSGVVRNSLGVSLVGIEDWKDFEPKFLEVQGGGPIEEGDLKAFREEVTKLIELEQSGVLRLGAWK